MGGKNKDFQIAGKAGIKIIQLPEGHRQGLINHYAVLNYAPSTSSTAPLNKQRLYDHGFAFA